MKKQRKMSGIMLNETELGEGDVIAFDYYDACEDDKTGTCTGTVVWENGAFVVHERGYKAYDWEWDHTRPALLYDWVTENECRRILN